MVTEITPGTDSKSLPGDAEVLIDVRDVKIYFSAPRRASASMSFPTLASRSAITSP